MQTLLFPFPQQPKEMKSSAGNKGNEVGNVFSKGIFLGNNPIVYYFYKTHEQYEKAKALKLPFVFLYKIKFMFL